MERRAVLRSLAAAAATGGAGCLDAWPDGATDGATDDGGGSTDGLPTVEGTSFRVTESGCGAARSEVTVRDERDSVVIEGEIPVADGASTAELIGASYDAGSDRLRVAVGTAARADGGADGPCPTVVGYRAQVELSGAGPGATAVYHDGVRVGGVDAGGNRVAETSFTVEEVTEGGGEDGGRDAATPRLEDGRLVVEGAIAASDGCATGVLDGVAVEGAGDRVTVDVATIPRTGGPCAEGGAAIAYRAVVRFAGAVPRDVTVRHGGDRIAGFTAATESAGGAGGAEDDGDEGGDDGVGGARDGSSRGGDGEEGSAGDGEDDGGAGNGSVGGG